MEKTKIILDCDPGHDDAVAIMLAAREPSLELLGVSVVAGNQTLENTQRNARNVLQWLGADIPVYAGCDRPMVRDKVIAADIHGSTGLDGPVFPPLLKRLEPEHAVQFLIRTLLESEGDITVVTTGPMTNLAMLIQKDPFAFGRIHEIDNIGAQDVLSSTVNVLEEKVFNDILFLVVFHSLVTHFQIRVVLQQFAEVIGRQLLNPSVREINVVDSGNIKCYSLIRTA